MKLLGLGCALVLGINSIHVQQTEHKGDYSIVPNWQSVCMDLGNSVCGIFDRDCCVGGNFRCNKTLTSSSCY